MTRCKIEFPILARHIVFFGMLLYAIGCLGDIERMLKDPERNWQIEKVRQAEPCGKVAE